MFHVGKVASCQSTAANAGAPEAVAVATPLTFANAGKSANHFFTNCRRWRTNSGSRLMIGFFVVTNLFVA
jgi:hypothetical protein